MKNHRERCCWLAAYTRSRHESQVANQLNQGRGIATANIRKIFPLVEPRPPEQGPTISWLRFVHVSNEGRVAVLQTTGVINIVSVAGKPATLGEEEIEKMLAFNAHASIVEPHPCPKTGQRVHVQHGPFTGWEGILVEKQNGTRLVISVEAILRCVTINIHGADVEPAVSQQTVLRLKRL